MAAEGGGEEAMGGGDFGGGDAGGETAFRLAVVEFVEEGGPHLLDAVGEAEFENAASDAGEGGFPAHVDPLPGLFAAHGVAEQLDPARVAARPAAAAQGTLHLEVPGVGLAGGDALGFDGEGEDVAGLRVGGLAEQGAVVPGLAGDQLPGLVGAQIGRASCRERV